MDVEHTSLLNKTILGGVKMHFIGIKCESCCSLANTKDSIEDLPNDWIALVQRTKRAFSNSRKEALHFCSMQCLSSWAKAKEQQS